MIQQAYDQISAGHSGASPDPLRAHHSLRRLTLGALLGLAMIACSSSPPRSVEPAVGLSPEPAPVRVFEVSEASKSETKAPGMTLHIHRKDEHPLVYLQLWLRAGAQLERPEALGAASLLQVLIAGDERDSTSLKGRLALLGARAKSWTTIDRAVFEVSARPERLKEVVDTLAEHILRPSWTQADLERAKAQLLSQHLDSRKWAGRRMVTRLLSQTYHGHPNGRLILPNEAQLKALDLSTLQAFYQRAYHPTRAHLIGVGGLNEERLREWVDEAWSGWGADGERALEPELAGYPLAELRGPDIELEVVGSGYAQLFLSLPVPHLTPEGVAYLDLASLLLVGDSDGLLYQAARRAGVDLKSARVSPISPDGPGALLLSFEVSPQQVDLLWRVILEQLYYLSQRPPSLRLLEQAKLLFERETVRVNGSLSSQARRLGFFSSRWPNTNAITRYGRAIAQSRPRDLKAYLSDLISSKRLHALIRSPAPEGVEASLWSERFREQALSLLDQRELDYRPGFHVIDEQLSMLFEPSDSDGAIHLELTVPITERLTRVRELSLGHWLAAQVSERAPHEPYFEATFHDSSLTISATMANDQLDEGLSGLLARVRAAPLVTEPRWSSDSLERARQRALSSLEMRRQQPWLKLRYLERRAVASGKRAALPSAAERAERLRKQGSASLVRWYQEHIQGRPALLVVSGDLEHQSLSSALQSLSKGAPGDALQVERLRGEPRGSQLKRCKRVLESSDHSRAWGSVSFDIGGLREDQLPALALLEAALSAPQGSFKRGLEGRYALKNFRTSAHESNQRPRLSLWFEVAADGYQRAAQQLQRALGELSAAPLELERFDDVKRYALSQQAHRLSTLKGRSRWLSRLWFQGWRGLEGERGALRSWWEALELVSPEALYDVARALSFERAVEALWAPPSTPFALKGCKDVKL